MSLLLIIGYITICALSANQGGGGGILEIPVWK